MKCLEKNPDFFITYYEKLYLLYKPVRGGNSDELLWLPQSIFTQFYSLKLVRILNNKSWLCHSLQNHMWSYDLQFVDNYCPTYMWSLPIWRKRPNMAPPFTPSRRGSKNPDIYEFRFFAFAKS